MGFVMLDLYFRSEIEIGQTIQWPKEKEQKDNDLQNITQKSKDPA
jgi:hypothetical protein